MTEVEILNRRLGDALGRPNGVDPRFAWKHSTELSYASRRSPIDRWRLHCWADRIARCWVLCQWGPPEITVQGATIPLTREMWFRMFGGERPYPEKGEYKPFCEAKLKPGFIPNDELTAFYARSLREQIESAELANREQFAGRMDATTEQCEAEAQREVDQAEQDFYDMADDWTPLSWKLGNPHDCGDNDGPVAFQVGGTRDQAA